MTRLLIWYGELATGRRLFCRGASFLLPALLWLTLFLMLPSIALVAVAFAQRGAYGEVVWQFTLKNFHRLLGYGLFGWSADYLLILLRSVWVALVTTVLGVVLSYPLAFFIASRRGRARYLWLALIILPFCTNLVIRTYAWQLFLSNQMPLARLAHWFGWLPEGWALYPGTVAVYLGMVSSFLPFAALPLYTSVERLDWSVVEAAQDLYASRWRVFVHAIVPQTIPGLTVALILTFIPAMGVFVVPDLLGGAKHMLIGNLIQQQFGASRDWPFGAAISMALMVLTLVGLFLLRRSGGNDRGGGDWP
ncbi:MAG TPA: ABC transporter permease [Phycisphaerae bacterium]|nr:ABC transporter permease [Phycisphaerae bacterium]HRY69164.1 ABC transporter permease [Phycisphaerae bacterium]HSA26125.1 ABC transporter permease [Phycisphaerae bacterium]